MHVVVGALLAVLTAVTAAVCAVWATRHWMIAREKHRAFVLNPACPGPPADAPMVSVVIAAKDEADNIGPCLRAMLRQDYPAFEVIVCNDRSTDGTAAAVEEVAAGDGRVRLIDIDALPPGWCGKNHAVHVGYRAARGEWLCTTDADCRQNSVRTLSVAMQHACDEGADLLSVLPQLEARGFWENVVQPVCGGVMMIWFHPDRVNDPSCPSAYANGAFILVRRSAYEAVGTHEAIKGLLMEDMHLARRIKQAGLSLRVVRGAGLYSVRMYSSLRGSLRGWSRIFYGSFGSLRRMVLSLLVLAVMGLLPYVAAAAGLTLAAAGAWPRWAWAAWAATGLAAAATQLSVIFRFYRLIRARPALAWTYPLGCLMAMLAVAGAIASLYRGLTWKGTQYPAGT